MKKVILILILMTAINSYAGAYKYLYFPFTPEFPAQNANNAIQAAFNHGIRSGGTLTGDTLLDFYNYFRNLPQHASFGFLYARYPDIPGFEAGLNGLVFAIDQDANAYSARKSIQRAIVRITNVNDPTHAARNILQERLNHACPASTAIVGLPDPTGPAGPTPTLILREIIMHATIIRPNLPNVVAYNTYYVAQPAVRQTVYPFLPSQRVFPAEPIAVVPHQDVTYAEACANNTRGPIPRLSLSAEPSGSACSNPPEMINAQEYLKRVNQHHVIRAFPAMQSFLLLN